MTGGIYIWNPVHLVQGSIRWYVPSSPQPPYGNPSPALSGSFYPFCSCHRLDPPPPRVEGGQAPSQCGLTLGPRKGSRSTKYTGTSQYVPYSIQGRTRNLKMVHTSTYQHRKFLWQYILVCTGMYCLVPAQYKVVPGGTRWYKMVQGGTNNSI
jgi:hypothetical protein